MTAISFSRIIGAFRLLRRRVAEVGHPALGTWAIAGESTAIAFRAAIVPAAHAAETCDEEGAREIDAGIDGLKDGRADPEDLAHFRRAARLLRRSAKLDHQIGETIAS